MPAADWDRVPLHPCNDALVCVLQVLRGSRVPGVHQEGPQGTLRRVRPRRPRQLPFGPHRLRQDVRRHLGQDHPRPGRWLPLVNIISQIRALFHNYDGISTYITEFLQLRGHFQKFYGISCIRKRDTANTWRKEDQLKQQISNNHLICRRWPKSVRFYQ